MIALRFKIAIALACVPALWAPSASAAERLDCMNAPFSAEDQAFLDNFVATFDLDNWSKTGGGDRLSQVLTARATDCGKTNAWNSAAEKAAFLHFGGTLVEQGLTTTAKLNADQIGLLRAAFAKADQARLLKIFGPQIDAEVLGDKPPSNDDIEYLETILRGSGVPPTDDNAIFAGALIGVVLTQSYWAGVFAAN